MNLTNEQKTEIKLRCLESAARIYQQFDLSITRMPTESALYTAKKFYEWVVNDNKDSNSTQNMQQ